MTGGELLAGFRQDHLSQQQLADLVDGSRSMIAQIELGTRQPSGKLLAALSQALDLSNVERAMLFLAHGCFYRTCALVRSILYLLLKTFSYTRNILYTL